MDNDTPLSSPIPDGFKRCTKCGTVKAVGEFSRNKASKDGCVTQCKLCNKQYYQENREQKKRYEKQYRLKNSESINQYRQANRERIAERMKQYSKQYLQKNSEQKKRYNKQYRLKNSEEIAERIKRYKQENRELFRIRNINYRARKRALPYTLTTSDWQHALDHFHGCCAVCERPLKDLFGTHTAAADHWIPLTSPECPGTIPTNIIPLCHGVGGCNNSKNDKHPEIWLKEQFGDKQAKKILQRIEAYFESIRQHV